MRPTKIAMATIVLSCSPSCSPVAVTPPHAAIAAMSSSPGLPSPSQLFSNMGPNQVRGSRATPLPIDALTGFTSASTFLRRSPSVNDVRLSSSVRRLRQLGKCDLQGSSKATTQPGELRAEEPKLPVFKMPKMLHERSEDVIEEKSARIAVVPPVNAVETAHVLAPKKSRKKKSKGEVEAQTTIKKTKITKPGAIKSGKKAAGSTTHVKEVVSAATSHPASTQEEDLRAREEFRNLCLEKAITRRREWTPPQDTAPDTTSPKKRENIDLYSAHEPLIARFGNFQGDFGLLGKEDGSFGACGNIRHGNDEAVTKKRRIDLVNGIPAPRVSEKPKRCKSPRKRPQTVTEKATAPFAAVDSVAPPSLLQYFGVPKSGSVIPAIDVAEIPDTSVTEGIRSAVKKGTKSKPKTHKAKKIDQKKPILLSPESAVKDARNQELIFGTSSQLAREESPAFLKELQLAMKESESTAELVEASAKDYDFLDLPSGRSRSSDVRAIAASKSLWSAASRDVDGSLVEVEIVNLADTPKPVPAEKQRIDILKVQETMEPRLKGEENTPSHTGETVEPAPKLDLNDAADFERQPEDAKLGIPRSVAEAALRNRPKSKSPVKKKSAAKATSNQKPDYNGFTDNQLRKEVAAYRFKTIKNRETMILLLERCWESKMSIPLQEVPANVSMPPAVAANTNTETSKSSSPPKQRRPSNDYNQVVTTAEQVDGLPPKRPRGRPKKDPTSKPPPKRKQKSKAPLSEALVTGTDDEIYDSTPPTPSPPKRRSSPKSPGQLQLNQPLETSAFKDARTSKGKDRALLLSQITKAITTFPPTHDIKNLTWYEKILMYDPIVLEDLTVWLNTEGLGRVDEDDEVWPGLVKEWCEERSVCCLWRENLRGGARGRW